MACDREKRKETNKQTNGVTQHTNSLYFRTQGGGAPGAVRSAYGGGNSRGSPASRCWKTSSPSSVETGSNPAACVDLERAGHCDEDVDPVEDMGIVELFRSSEELPSDAGVVGGYSEPRPYPASTALFDRRTEVEGKFAKAGLP